MIELFPERTIVATIGSFTIYWYGLLYLIAFGIASLILPRLQSQRNLKLTGDQWLGIVVASMVGVVVGGRLGYVLFYEPSYFLQNPLEIVQLWRGGMSFHGGLIGTTLALIVSARLLKINLWSLADIVVIPAALGLAFGRLGNFINQELYGTLTTLPWGVVIPDTPGLRHPVQLYAVIKNLLIAGICAYYLFKIRPTTPGRTAALFLVLYGAGRLFISRWREPDGPVWTVGEIVITEGQLLTILVAVSGIIMWHIAARGDKAVPG